MSEQWLDKRALAQHLACSVRSIQTALAGGCADCGKTLADCAGKGKRDQLEFHHLDPATKSFTVGLRHEHRRRSIAELEAEIAKCAVLCKSCHSRRHAIEMHERGGWRR